MIRGKDPTVEPQPEQLGPFSGFTEYLMFENWLASFIDRDRPPGAMSFMDNKGVMGEWQRSERALLYNRLEAAFAALQLPWGEQEGSQHRMATVINHIRNRSVPSWYQLCSRQTGQLG